MKRGPGRPRLIPGGIPHGHPAGYGYHKCRCVDCTEAHRVANRQSRQRKAQRSWRPA